MTSCAAQMHDGGARSGNAMNVLRDYALVVRAIDEVHEFPVEFSNFDFAPMA